jgi:hypothetical protein
VYDWLEVPNDNLYPAIFGSGFGFHAAVIVVARTIEGSARTKMKASAVKIHSRV